jgi:hypothetical protein
MVLREGLEPSRLSALVSKTSVSAIPPSELIGLKGDNRNLTPAFTGRYSAT